MEENGNIREKIVVLESGFENKFKGTKKTHGSLTIIAPTNHTNLLADRCLTLDPWQR